MRAAFPCQGWAELKKKSDGGVSGQHRTGSVRRTVEEGKEGGEGGWMQ